MCGQPTQYSAWLAHRHEAVAGFRPLSDFSAAFDPVAGLHEGAHGRSGGLAVVLFLSVMRNTESPLQG